MACCHVTQCELDSGHLEEKSDCTMTEVSRGKAWRQLSDDRRLCEQWSYTVPRVQLQEAHRCLICGLKHAKPAELGARVGDPPGCRLDVRWREPQGGRGSTDTRQKKI